MTSRDDVADFYITVRSLKNADPSAAPIVEEDIPYAERTHLLDRLPATSGPLQLCVLARDSQGAVRVWRASQCRPVPNAKGYNSAEKLTEQSLILLASVLMINYFLSYQ